MKQSIIHLLVFLLCSPALFARAANYHSNWRSGYSLRYHDHWALQADNDQGALQLASPDGSARLDIIVVEQSAASTAEELLILLGKGLGTTPSTRPKHPVQVPSIAGLTDYALGLFESEIDGEKIKQGVQVIKTQRFLYVLLETVNSSSAYEAELTDTAASFCLL